jgi:hypothetical protein
MIENFKDNFLVMSLLRYGFHITVFLVFYFIVDRSYFPVQQYFVQSLSSLRYDTPISVSQYVFNALLFFSILCYWADYRIIRQCMLKEYKILYLLVLDAFCLLLATLVMVCFNNLVYNRKQIVDALSLNSIPTVLVLIYLKNWIFIRMHSKKAGAIPNISK